MISCVEVDCTICKAVFLGNKKYSTDRQFIWTDCQIFHFVLNSLTLARLIQALPVSRSRELRSNPGEKFCLRRFTVAHHQTLERSLSCSAPPPESPVVLEPSLATLARLVSGPGIISPLSDHDEPQDPTH